MIETPAEKALWYAKEVQELKVSLNRIRCASGALWLVWLLNDDKPIQ